MTARPLSEAQSRALYDRETPYTEAHRNSYVARFERATPPTALRELVRDLRSAYSDEVPSRIHCRDTDAGGDPAWSPEFSRYLTGSDFATDRADEGTTEVYVTPFRACFTAMSRGNATAARRARIVARIVVGGVDPVAAAVAEQSHPLDAELIAKKALEVFWCRYSDVRLDLRTHLDETTTAA